MRLPGLAPDKSGLDPITIVIEVVDEHPPSAPRKVRWTPNIDRVG